MRNRTADRRRLAKGRLPLVLVSLAAVWAGRCEWTCAGEPVGTVEVVMADGPTSSGRLKSFDADQIVLEASPEEERRLPRANALSVRFSASPESGTGLTSWLLFPNGDRASLEALRIEEESLICRWRSYPAWNLFRVPLETASGLIVNPPGSKEPLGRLVQELSRGPFNTDVLILLNRDRVSGELQSISAEHYELNTPVGPVRAPTSQVQAVAFNSSLVNFPEATGETVLATLTDGSWLTLVDAQLDASGILAGKTLFGEPVAFPLGALESLTLSGPRVCFLSMVTPASSRTQPYLSPSVSTPPVQNRNVRGGILALRGREFPRGVGMTSASRATWSLDGGYQSFRATIGIDDEAEGGGSVVFAVEVDGRRIFTSAVVTGRDAPIDVGPLDVREAGELTLIVEYGEYGDILDVADWGNAILVRRVE